MRIAVTGANGFVGRWLVRHLIAEGHQVTGLTGGDGAVPDVGAGVHAAVTWRRIVLEEPETLRRALADGVEAVVHLAGMASVVDSLGDPEAAWRANTLGTVALLEAVQGMRRSTGAQPRFLLVSSAEVYGRGDHPRREADPVAPVSPYGASKAAAELAVLEAWRRTGLRVMVARPFPHTGVGQSEKAVVPALCARVRAARREGVGRILAGNLSPVRDLLDVRDVVGAYALLLRHGEAGRTYNVARGTGIPLAGVLQRIGTVLGHEVTAEVDPALLRPVDIPVLVGDPSAIMAATGWTPRHSLDDTLQWMLDAETD